MKIRFGFLKFEKEVDDVYLLPTIGIGKYHSEHGWGWGVGIKFLKLQLAIRFLYSALSSNSDYTRNANKQEVQDDV